MRISTFPRSLLQLIKVISKQYSQIILIISIIINTNQRQMNSLLPQLTFKSNKYLESNLKSFSRLIIFLFFFQQILSQGLYNKIIPKIDSQAKCLDGSPGAFYLHKGNNNLLIYFQGGGVCGDHSLSLTLENCYKRSKTAQGSSLYWPQQLSAEGILSTNPNDNIFANWTKAIFLYCDGSFHQGVSKSPYKYKDSQLYFRGSLITRSHLKYLNTIVSFEGVDKFVVSGSSAGGIASFIWTEQIKKIVGKHTKVYNVVDSAILLKNDQLELNNLVALSNKDQSVNQQCFHHFGQQNQWNCLTLQGFLPFIKTQTLFIQSAYDQFIIGTRLGLKCLIQGQSGFSLANCSDSDMNKIEVYRAEYMKYLNMILNGGHNIWSIACSWHAVIQFGSFYRSALQKVPKTKGLTMEQAIYRYVFEEDKVLSIDLQAWPDNIPCAF